jgi:hypothetical protein
MNAVAVRLQVKASRTTRVMAASTTKPDRSIYWKNVNYFIKAELLD